MRSFRKDLCAALALATALAILCAPAIASAQTTSASTPLTTTTTTSTPTPTLAPASIGLPPVQIVNNPFQRGDTLSPNALSHDIAMMPLRLSLLGDAYPLANSIPGCAANAENAGNTLNGFTLQRSFAMPLMPHLTLVGFSQTACQYDAAVGGGLVYTAPIRKDLWFTASAGALVLPHGNVTRPSYKSDARVDVVWRESNNRAWSVGVGLRGIKLGGVF
jgi:hypothetical protein